MPTNHELAIQLFLQLAVILVTSRGAGLLLRYVGQTQVACEMITGVLLGPSFFGLIAPEVQHFLFPSSLTLNVAGSTATIPHPSMSILYALSQVGLSLYMFFIGLQFDLSLLSKHLKQVGGLSLSGILAPTLIGGMLGLALAGNRSLFADNIASWQAALFMASAMLITAFPMLARMLYAKGIANTKLGTLTISAAAVDDAVSWIMLAVVLATAKNSSSIAALAIGGGLVYAITMRFFGRRLFRSFSRVTVRENGVGMGTLTAVLFVLMLCCWFTDKIGVYSVFGAFILGVVIPRGQFANETSQVIEKLNVALLLPIFFVYSGLNTQIGLLVEPSLFWITLVTLILAFICRAISF